MTKVRIGRACLCLAAAATLSCNPATIERLFLNGPADVMVNEMGEMRQLGRMADVVACVMDSSFCNRGGEPQDWYPNPDPRHPFVVFNLYRLMNDRFEQIGQSWAKHGTGAAQRDECGFGCIPIVNGTRLGAGCSDTYSVDLNSEQRMFGPRSEINPFTGAFAFTGSHFETQAEEEHSPIEHRLQVRDSDIDPAANPGAVYYCEQYILSHDDADPFNSIAHEITSITGTPGGIWEFDIAGAGTQMGPAISAWFGAQATTIPQTTTDDGRCLLSARATATGTGAWHYEYALFNLDMDRGVRRFALPLPSGVTVTNVGFHAVASHDEPFTNDPWVAAQDAQSIAWETPACCDVASNPLRWGTLYNFRFDADAPPASATVTLGLYKPGSPDSLTGITIGPVR
jgi:hypothetical protein